MQTSSCRGQHTSSCRGQQTSACRPPPVAVSSGQLGWVCSDPRTRPDPIGESEPKPRGCSILFLFIFCVIQFSFSKVSRPESPARPEWRIRTGARFTPTFSFILTKRFIMSFRCGSGFSFERAYNNLQFQCNSVDP